MPTATPLPQATATPQPTATAEPPVAAALAAPAAAKAAAPVEIPLESLPIIRERFPQTLYWNPEVVTDDTGRLSVSVPTGDAITTWRVTALAVDRNGRLGSAVAPLVVFQPVFVTSNLPAQMTVGEQFDARVQIFNYSRQAQTVRLAAQASTGLRVEPSAQSLVVPANEVVAITARVQAVSSGTANHHLHRDGQQLTGPATDDDSGPVSLKRYRNRRLRPSGSYPVTYRWTSQKVVFLQVLRLRKWPVGCKPLLDCGHDLLFPDARPLPKSWRNCALF